MIALHCMPKGQLSRHRFHFLYSERAVGWFIAEWISGDWYVFNEVGPISVAEMARRGYEYWGPVVLPANHPYGLEK